MTENTTDDTTETGSAEPSATLDPRALRHAFGAFMTGVTVTTTREQGSGAPRGFTANSFTSVSLDPPLLLVCLGKGAASRPIFEASQGFAVNVLAEHQQEVSTLFSSRVEDRFAQVAWRDGPLGNPLLEGAAAWFDCTRHQVVDAGDHVILIGRIGAFAATEQNGLGYARGGYFTLGLEQAAVAAAAGGPNLMVGAVVERGDAVLLEELDDGSLRTPLVGRRGRPGSVERLKAHLESFAPGVRLGPLYAVYENAPREEHGIFYRAFAPEQSPAPTGAAYHPIQALPLDRVADGPIRSMLARFSEEHRNQRFGVYYGDASGGEVRIIAG